MTMQIAAASRTCVGDLEIAYQSSGSGDPALVFVHGAAADRSYFSPQLAHLAGRRRLVALDLRGHGESSITSRATMDDFAADVLGVLDAAHLDRAVICGHSMAGVVGLKVALARPELVRGLALIESTVLFPEEVRQRGLATFVSALANEHAREALHGFFKNVILDPLDPPELVERVLAAVDRTSPEFARAVFTSLWSSDFATELENVRCPLLYIHAKTPTDLQRLRRLRPDAWVGEVVGSGHYPMLTVPDQVNAMLDRFLEVVDGKCA